ncbi:MAG: arsenate reductase ArsC [Oleispira antarctica]|uniref:Putative phosphotyrosine protein phosphatase n=1 Tax=Oleispira antarctica RB-8 TaxID=698738 RepID=R4YJR2_OLEAN|nr:arsenate reductase ArsC [Oleispira antarctica]MBQ0793964.1 arsenate reductase ArsC [Oleispira antarctica]CCK74355.1 putative phosphotyrosine protein phosphatase [Oleispira antarctica RB-8]|tara:strand:- start:1440 stop:1847 length:408 start_codon:yes stop_codon:yes gene_type:complete
MKNEHEKKMKKVIFVCIENSCRSQMAEAFGKMHGAGKLEVYSSGSKPSGQVNPRAIEFMAELGYDLSQHDSKPLSEFEDMRFDYAITMGCGDECPMITADKREDWGIPDPKHEEPERFREIRSIIEEKVKALISA